MLKKYFFKLVLIGLFLILSSTQANAQLFTANSVSLNNYSGDTCSVFAATINTYLGCINFTQGGVSKSLNGTTINIDVHYTSSPICAGAISYPVFNTNLRRIPPGTYTIVANAYLDNNYINSATDPNSLVVAPCTVTSLEENSISNFTIYPNPANNFINLELPEGYRSSLNYRILDLKGSELMSGITNKSSNIDVSNLASGVYFVKIEDSKSISIKKLIIK